MRERFNLKDVREAAARISPYIYRTPLEKSLYLSTQGQEFYLKLECAQPVKAFKIRGALNKLLLLTDEEKQRGVITISSGNHGISVSYGARLLGIETAVVIVPCNTPRSKVDKIRYFGGRVLLMGNNYDEAHELGDAYRKEHGMVFIDGWDNDEAVYAGQGTMALEILEQNPDIDTILAPIGGGGMCTGIAAAAKGVKKNVKVIGVQTEACPAMQASIRDETLYNYYPSGPSVCEALIGGVGHIAYEMRGLLDDILIVTEENIKRAVAFMAKKEKIIAEPSGAITIGAALQYGGELPGSRIALVVSGGNVDEELFVEVLNEY